MNRVWDYVFFAIWFVGLGYVALWLLGSPGHLMLPPGLHAVGAAAATVVPIRFALCMLRRRRAGACAVPSVRARKATDILQPARRKPTYPIRQVKARSQFGLRGMPR